MSSNNNFFTITKCEKIDKDELNHIENSCYFNSYSDNNPCTKINYTKEDDNTYTYTCTYDLNNFDRYEYINESLKKFKKYPDALNSALGEICFRKNTDNEIVEKFSKPCQEWKQKFFEEYKIKKKSFFLKLKYKDNTRLYILCSVCIFIFLLIIYKK